MNNFPETRESLILQVKDRSNRIAWEQFAQLYRPVIYRIARTRGMQEADAQDLAQQVLLAVSTAIPRWEKQSEQTRFRHWLSKITKNAIIKAVTRPPRDQASGGSTAIDLLGEIQADPQTEKLISLEYRRELYLRAAETVREEVQPATWQAFDLTVLQGQTIEQAARQLDRPKGAVYTGRSRVMFRLREAVRALEAAEE